MRSTAIPITVFGGEMTMTADVTRRVQRGAAGQVVKRLSDLRTLTNRVALSRVRAKGLSEQISKLLKKSAVVDAARVSVSDSVGVVILTGSVRSFAERKEVHRSAWQAPGVISVINEIVIED